MIVNMNGGGKGASYDANVTVSSDASSISFSVAKEPKSWAVMFSPSLGATLSAFSSNKYIMAYLKNDDYSGGIVANSSAVSISSTITATYNNGTFTLTASGGEKFRGISDNSAKYRLMYAY